MKTVFAALPAALAILAFSFQTPAQAQATPDGQALQHVGKKLCEAMVTGTHEELFNVIAPWLQGRAELNDESMDALIRAQLEEIPEDEREDTIGGYEESLAETMGELDPAGTLGVKTVEDYLALQAATLFATEVKQLVIRADEALAENRKAKWHEVNRLIYTADVEIENREEPVEQTFGEIRFMNRFDDVINIICVADGSRWAVTHFEGSIGEHDFSLEDSVVSYEPGEWVVSSNSRDARRAEGEQLMGAARDYLRVEYAKTGAAPKTLSETDEAEDVTSWFEGLYFSIRDKVYKKPDMERGAVVAVPVDEEDGWGAMYFDYASGESEIKWYASEEELDEALKNFQTAK